MTYNLRVLVLVATLLAICAVTATALRAQEGSHSIWDGIYTDAQAKRGAAAYATHCAQCHGDSLSGNGADIPALAGTSFLYNWDGLGLDALIDRIHTTMPQSNPGSLSVSEVADITAYLLSVNQLPTGSTELPSDTQSLQKIQFVAKKPDH
ncbi:MAG: cytochrome c [Steroidobacteraceae bacterium]